MNPLTQTAYSFDKQNTHDKLKIIYLTRLVRRQVESKGPALIEASLNVA